MRPYQFSETIARANLAACGELNGKLIGRHMCSDGKYETGEPLQLCCGYVCDLQAVFATFQRNALRASDKNIVQQRLDICNQRRERRSWIDMTVRGCATGRRVLARTNVDSSPAIDRRSR